MEAPITTTTTSPSSSSFSIPQHLLPSHVAGEITSPPERPPGAPPVPFTSTAPDHDQSNQCNEIYVVQVPREQIYRVPPPENASIIERHRIDLQSRRKKQSPFISFVFWFFGGLLILGIILLVSAIIFFLVVQPALPDFTINRLLVIASSHRNQVYELTMRTKNRSGRMGLYYQKGDNAILAHRSINIAEGGTPEFFDMYKDAKEFKLVLDGQKIVLPKQIKRSLNGSKEVVPLSLSVMFPIKLAIGEMRLWRMRMAMVCDIKARALGKRTCLVSQRCKAKIHV